MNARTPYLKLLSASTMALLVIMVAGYLMSERASAQRIPPPSDPVLAAVQDVQRSLVGLQAHLDALQTGLDWHVAPSHFRWTPAATSVADGIRCMVVNISNVEKTIHIEAKTRDGSAKEEKMVNVAPGAIGLIAVIPGNHEFDIHCKFTVINGTRADIRGTLLGFGPSGRQSFQIPAE